MTITTNNRTEERRLTRFAPAPALATCMHLHWIGVASDLRRLGVPGLDHVIDGAQAGEIYPSGHAEVGNDVPVVLSTTRAETVHGGYRITGAKQRMSDMVRFVIDTAMDVARGSSVRSDNELSRLLRDSRAVTYHPPAAAIAHEGIGKALLAIDPEGSRW
jgi:alkylation response protein AidB-like acyl-CoA dehydrogenase